MRSSRGRFGSPLTRQQPGLVGVIAGPNKGSTCDVGETHFLGLPANLGELIRMNESLDGQMLGARLQILAYGQEVNAGIAKVGKRLQDFFVGFAESEHDSALRDGRRESLFDVAQNFEADGITGSSADSTLKSSDRFNVMVEDVRLGGEDDID